MDKTELRLANERAAAAQIAYFRTIPWCASYLDSPTLVINQSVSRALKPAHSNLDSLISRTLNRPDAIPAYITFYSPPSSSSSSPSPPNSRSGNQDGSTPDLVTEVSALVALGPMINGWDGICHGGIVATLLDEVMGQVFAVNKQHGALNRKVPAMTGYLNTRYERPVRTGGKEKGGEGREKGVGEGKGANVVLVRARLVKREGRKFWLEAEVVGPGKGGKGEVVLARGEALFIMLKKEMSKL